jgi:hypothetical protein
MITTLHSQTIRTCEDYRRKHAIKRGTGMHANVSAGIPAQCTGGPKSYQYLLVLGPSSKMWLHSLTPPTCSAANSVERDYCERSE